jgi:Protein of unknown function (DUF1569)
MNNLYSKEDVAGIVTRIEKLMPNAERHWGKMDVGQMLAHLNISLETAMGLNFPNRIFIGRILGSFFKKKALDTNPLQKNSPTDKNYKFTDTKEFEKEKSKSMELIHTFHKNGPSKCTSHTHPFFGKMTPDEWAILQWKHFDHHLRQFGA